RSYVCTSELFSPQRSTRFSKHIVHFPTKVLTRCLSSGSASASCPRYCSLHWACSSRCISTPPLGFGRQTRSFLKPPGYWDLALASVSEKSSSPALHRHYSSVCARHLLLPG